MGDEKVTKAAPAETPSHKKMSDADYAVARELYERDEASLADLAEEYGISRNALWKRFQADKVVKGSKSALVKAEKAVERFIERRSDWIEETRYQGYQALRQVQLMARKIAMDAIKSGAPMGTVDEDLKAVGRLNKILCDNVTVSLNVLDAHKHVEENNLPMLVIEDLTDQEVLEHHKATGAFDEDATLDDLLKERIGDEDDI